jgi:S1-C subfamily serine protease
VVVASVEPGSPAEQGGLAAGDMVLALDGTTITGADDLIRTLTGDRIGRNVTVETLRNGNRHSLALVPTERTARSSRG